MILKKSLLSFLNETQTISPYKHGYLPRRSYLSNLLVFVEVVTRMMDEVYTVVVICFGFAKASDSVNHKFLLAKMKSFGLGDVVGRWIEAYLSERASRGHVGGELSKKKD